VGFSQFTWGGRLDATEKDNGAEGIVICVFYLFVSVDRQL